MNQVEKQEQIAEIIDELGPLERKIKASTYERDKKRRDALRKQLVELLGLRRNQGASEAGEKWAIEISACEPRRAVCDNARVFEILGRTKFLELAIPAIGDLEENLSPSELEEVLTSDRTGPRKYTAMELFQEMEVSA